MILYLLHEKYSEKWELYMILLLFSLYATVKSIDNHRLKPPQRMKYAADWFVY